LRHTYTRHWVEHDLRGQVTFQVVRLYNEGGVR
jgi:hypothetical protein